MGGMSSQVIWKQTWSTATNAFLVDALRSTGATFSELASQEWDPKTSTIGGVPDYKASYVSPAAETWTSVLLHLDSLIAEPLAKELSRAASVPALAVFEYDQGSWGYSLFERGQLLDRCWDWSSDFPRAAATGNPDIVAKVFGVERGLIAAYVRPLTEEDEFSLDDHWVRVDFMRRLGLAYPAPGRTVGGRYILISKKRGR
jgi:hypothetical protein